MRRLAELEQATIKLSMLTYQDPEWDSNQLVKETVLKIIDLFGIDRCFFASNFPVEQHLGWSASRLYQSFHDLVKHFSEDEQNKLPILSESKFGLLLVLQKFVFLSGFNWSRLLWH